MTEEKKHGPDCDCGCQEDVPKITLEFDDGEEIECEPLFIFDYQDQDYIALVPVDSTDEDVFLYLYCEYDNGEFEFLDIEDDATFDAVAAEFERIIEEASLREEENN